jgi:serine/threonine-protein kinase RsbW
MKGNADSLILNSSSSELNKVEKLVEALADKYYLNDSYFANIMVALTEAFNNALIHGNRNDKEKKISIGFSVTEKEMIFDIRDEGDGFDHLLFLNTKHGDNHRGIELIQSVSDKVEFTDNGRCISIHFNVASVNNNISQNRMSAFGQQIDARIKQKDEKKRN